MIWVTYLSPSVADCDFTIVVVVRNPIDRKKYVIISIVHPTYMVHRYIKSSIYEASDRARKTKPR